MTMLQLGDPATRPDDDHCFLPTTYDIEASLHEWESTAAISWSLTGPPSTGPKEIKVAIRDEFRLRLGEVLVTRHHPKGPPGDARYQQEAFLIKFLNCHQCEQAVKHSYVKCKSIDIRFVKWQSLRTALGISLLFLVKLYLDGVPRHVWNADIMERIVSVHCALEDIETNLQRPKETKTIDVWTWTANPCLISKRVWLVFTSKVRDAKLPSV
jgi:hypothetical protein